MFNFNSYKILLDDCYEFNNKLAKELYPEFAGEKIGFLYDGPTDPQNWNKISPKILFIAKEHYGYWNCDPRYIWKFDDKDKNLDFYKNISLISYLINDYYNKKMIYSDDEISKLSRNGKIEIENGWKKLAFIEVKKISGYNVKSSDTDIRFHANKNKYYLVKQIEMINPDIIFSCGPIIWKILIDDLGLFDRKKDNINDKDWCFWGNNKLLINSYHPSMPGFNIKVVYREIVNFIKSKM